MASAQVPGMIKVGAFIGMHGGIDPINTHKNLTSKDKPPTYECEISATPLPPGINLFAPANLGYQYISSHIEITQLIDEIHKAYVSRQSTDYIKFCLQQIRSVETDHVTMVRKYVDNDHRAIKKSEEDLMAQRPKRIQFGEVTTLKPRIQWKKHRHYITEKKYETHSSDEPCNSIMFFCQEIPEGSLEKAKEAFEHIIRENPQYANCVVRYNKLSRIYSIDFEYDIYMIPFKFILDILNTILQAVLPDSRYELSIFDFSCSELYFDEALEAELEELTPVFIHCDDDRMTYGTNRAEVLLHHNVATETLAYAGEYTKSPDRHTRSHFVFHKGPSHTPSPVHPTPYIVIRLADPIKAFLDLDTRVEETARSVSPPRSKQKTKGGRTRNRKKARRMRRTNRRIRAKGSTRRARK